MPKPDCFRCPSNEIDRSEAEAGSRRQRQVGEVVVCKAVVGYGKHSKHKSALSG
jgi:hypothetical protein